MGGIAHKNCARDRRAQASLWESADGRCVLSGLSRSVCAAAAVGAATGLHPCGDPCATGAGDCGG